MCRPDGRGGRQVGDGARYLQHPVIGAGRPVHVRHRGAQRALAGPVECAVAVDLVRAQALVRLALARDLQRMGAGHARGDGRRALAVGLGAHRFRRHGAHLDLHVDAVEQGTGNAVPVALRRLVRAMALAGRMALPAAGTGIHGGHELEARREVGLVRGARDGDAAGFQRLAQHLQHLAIELGYYMKIFVCMPNGNGSSHIILLVTLGSCLLDIKDVA